MGTTNGVANGEMKETLVVGQTSQGADVHATLLRLTRYAAVMEVYTPGLVLCTSEVFENFRIMRHDRTLYSGRAVVRSVVDAGLAVVCEVKLEEEAWTDVVVDPGKNGHSDLRHQFEEFTREWQKLYKVSPEFKLAVADLQSFLAELRVWLEQVELTIRSQPAGCRVTFERETLDNLKAPVFSNLASLFERFELATVGVEKDLQSVHSTYAKRQLHPLVLCAPFMYRTFCKPLGYAGDYEMVNMMTRDCFQGGSVFAKVLNAFFLETPPVVAHRNRIQYLGDMLLREGDRAARRGGIVKIMNLGCGPALEVQGFMTHSPLSSRADFTLLDFNDETVEHTRRTLNQIKLKNERHTAVQVIKKSVVQLLKDSAKAGSQRYDLIYCAGLFDYLTDPVCEKLLSLFYEMAAPGGLVVATNVDASNPARGWMEYMVDWHLCYRDSRDFAGLLPKAAPEEGIRIVAEPTGVNIFAEIRKPKNA